MPLTDTDRKLLGDLLSGQSASWKQFVDRFTGFILQVIHHTAQVHSLRLTPEDIEDLCADTLTELLVRDMAALRSFRGRCSLATYLAVITRRVVVRKLTEHRYLNAMGHANAHHAALDRAAAESAAAKQAEQRDQVENLLSRLPEEARRILQWIYLDGISYRQVAERLARPLNSIGPLLSRIRIMARIGS